MKISFGKYKNRKILTDGSGYSPTSTVNRQRIFNILMQNNCYTEIADSIVADICCGCGSLGIEALSRGARKVYFLDSSLARISLVNNNLDSIKALQHAVALVCDATIQLPIQEKCNIIFIDPPYDQPFLISKILKLIKSNSIYAPEHIVVIEKHKNAEVNYSDLEILDNRTSGITELVFGIFGC